MKKLLIATLLILALLFTLTACDLPFLSGEEHDWGAWEVDVEATCSHRGMKVRICEDCGEEQTRSIDMLEHTPVASDDVPATCAQEGKTGGTHCSVCGEVLTAPTTTAKGGHDYSVVSIETPASCTQEGTKKISCANCGESVLEPYALDIYTATEINKQALEYVGEITTYDRNGNALGLGTGFVYTADGKVITNHHVIDGAYSAEIAINGKIYKIQKVLAYDATIDLAVVQIDAKNLPYATLCSQPMEVGNTVYAIGSSRGMTNTFSQGIITYFDRQVDGVSHIQHDASITNGNSGGPLVNSYGEVVGVNTWGIADSQNLNFAVFIKELDNLNFGKAVTLEELYSSSINAYDYLLTWLANNYNYSDGYDDVRYDYDIPSKNQYLSLGYDVDDDYLYLDLLVAYDDGDMFYILLDLSVDPSAYEFYATYESSDGACNEAVGYIDTANFTETSSLYYDAYQGGNWSEASVKSLYQNGIVYMLKWLESLMSSEGMDIGMTDLGFAKF